MVGAIADTLNAGYRPRAPFRDELFELDGTPRPAARALVDELGRLGPQGLVEAGRRRDAIFMQQGITFETSGESGASHERPFPLDLIPGCSAERNGERSSAAWPSASGHSTTSSMTFTTRARSCARG